jgi:hypothetical protein
MTILPLSVNHGLRTLQTKWTQYNREQFRKCKPGSLLYEIYKSKTDLSETEMLATIYEVLIFNDTGIYIVFTTILYELSEHGQEILSDLPTDLSYNSLLKSNLSRFVSDVLRQKPMLKYSFPETTHRPLFNNKVPTGSWVVLGIETFNRHFTDKDTSDNLFDTPYHIFGQAGSKGRTCPGKKIIMYILMLFVITITNKYDLVTKVDNVKPRGPFTSLHHNITLKRRSSSTNTSHN